MREILFRGKWIRTGEWIEGTGIVYDGVNTWMLFNEPDTAIAFGIHHVIVDPASVGQFTGETDRNGKKIFEGDTVICSLPSANYNPPHSWNRKQIVYERGAFWAEDRAGERVPLTDYVTSVEIEVVQDETEIL